MADKIELRDAQYGVEMGWHGKTRVVELITKELAFQWKVVLAPILYRLGGKEIEHGKWVLPIADDDNLPLGFAVPVNTETYTVRTPQETWDFLMDVVKGTDSTVVSAGTVQNRSKFFISVKLNELERVKIDDGSEIEIILNGMGSLDKSLNEKICISGIRTVCYNTLMLNFLQAANAWKFRHSKNMVVKMEEKKPLIEQMAGFSAIVKATFDKMVAAPCTPERAERIYTGFLVPETAEEISKRAANMIEQHVECFRTGDGNAGATEFDLLNGFTQLRTRGYTDSKKDSWDVFETSEFGTYSNDKVEFAQMLIPDKNGNRLELAKVEARGAELLAA